jgi:hypothetical protein
MIDSNALRVLLIGLLLFAGFTPGAIFGATEGEASMATVSVRYIVDDVQAAVAFYTQHLGFNWNRIQLEVQDLASEVEKLREAGVRFRNDIVTGNGGKQILVEDPAGNPIELFEPAPKR